MNDVVKRELEKVRAPLPDYNDDTSVIKIPKHTNIIEDPYVKGLCCILQLAPYILKEPPNFSLSSNWNKGIVPVSEFLKIEIVDVYGNMIKVDGIGFEYETQTDKQDSYLGLWLPKEGTHIVAKL